MAAIFRFGVLLVLGASILLSLEQIAAAAGGDLKGQILGAWSLRDQPDCRAGRIIFSGDDFILTVHQNPAGAQKPAFAQTYRLQGDALEFPLTKERLESVAVQGSTLSFQDAAGNHTAVRCTPEDLDPADLALLNSLVGRWTTGPDCRSRTIDFGIDGEYRTQEPRGDGTRKEIHGVFWLEAGKLNVVQSGLTSGLFIFDATKPPTGWAPMAVRFEGARMLLDNPAGRNPSERNPVLERCPS
jgi:hypothetical protein